MAVIKGAWRAKAFGGTPFASVLKQGTGINPIHSQYGDRVGPDPGRSMVPIHGFSNPGYAGAVPQIIEQNEYGYQDEDLQWSGSEAWGYGTQTGLADRGSLDQGHELTSGANEAQNIGMDAQPWGEKVIPPGGSYVRSLRHGGGTWDRPDSNDPKLSPTEDDVAQGWLNKQQSYVEDAVTSDPRQYEMQTSMMQRDQVKAGSQAASGRANEFDAPIKSRITPMKWRQWGAPPNLPGHEQRHDDMYPYQQDLIVRPWWYRQGGTGYPEWGTVNELYVSEPLQRTPPDNPDQGIIINQPEAGASIPSSSSPTETNDYKYTDEDLSWY